MSPEDLLPEDVITTDEKDTFIRVLHHEAARLHNLEQRGEGDHTSEIIDLVQKGMTLIPLIESDPTIIPVHHHKKLSNRPRFPSLRTVKKAALCGGLAVAITGGGIEVANLWNIHIQADKVERAQALQRQLAFEHSHVLPKGKDTVISAKGWQMSYTFSNKLTTYHRVAHSPLNFSITSDAQPADKLNNSFSVPKDNPSWIDQHFGDSNLDTDIQASFYKNSKGQEVPQIGVVQFEGNTDHPQVVKESLLQKNTDIVFKLHKPKHTYYIQMTQNQFVPTEYDFQQVDPVK